MESNCYSLEAELVTRRLFLWPCSNGLIHTFARDSTAFLGILFFSVLSSDLFSLMSYMKESHLEITEKTRIPRTEVQNMSRS